MYNKLFVFLSLSIITAVAILFLYRIFYQTQIEKKLRGNDNVIKLPDLKSVAIIVLSLIITIATTLSFTSYREYKSYIESDEYRLSLIDKESLFDSLIGLDRHDDIHTINDILTNIHNEYDIVINAKHHFRFSDKTEPFKIEDCSIELTSQGSSINLYFSIGKNVVGMEKNYLMSYRENSNLSTFSEVTYELVVGEHLHNKVIRIDYHLFPAAHIRYVIGEYRPDFNPDTEDIEHY